MIADLGWANVGAHSNQPEVLTPTMNQLISDGILLERTYSFMFCSPTRSSLLSGRFPIHVNTLNADPSIWSSESSEGAGIATNMSGIGELLKEANYSTAAVGKWFVCERG